MDFPHGSVVERLRAPAAADRYSGRDTNLDWDNAVPTPILNAWVGGSSTSRNTDQSRTQYLELVSLYCQPDTDLRVTDRIRVGGEGGTTYEIEGLPPVERNPFTGWAPVREVPLGNAVG